MQTLSFDLSISFDICQAQHLFDENFSKVERSDLLEYVDYGNIKSSYDLGDWQNFKATKEQIKIAMLGYFNNEDLKYNSNNYFDKPFSKLCKQELQELSSILCYGSQELDEFLTVNFTSLYEVLTSRGYSQGDYTQVVFSKECIAYLQKETGKTWDQLVDGLQTEIDHLLWDQPLYARLTVNDNDEIYLDELLKDIYSYDKDDLLSEFKRVYSGKLDSFDEVYQYLSENLPDQPEYTY